MLYSLLYIGEDKSHSQLIAQFCETSQSGAEIVAKAIIAAMRKNARAANANANVKPFQFKHCRVEETEVDSTEPEAASTKPVPTKTSKNWSDKWQCNPRQPSPELRKARREAMANRQPMPSM